jgi:hypothetical protein
MRLIAGRQARQFSLDSSVGGWDENTEMAGHMRDFPLEDQDAMLRVGFTMLHCIVSNYERIYL